MTELLDLINSLLVYVFEIIANFITPYLFLVMMLAGIGLAIQVVWYIAKMARTHT